MSDYKERFRSCVEWVRDKPRRRGDLAAYVTSSVINDDEDPDDVGQYILDVYDQAMKLGDETVMLVDSMLSAICGWSLDTIVENLIDNEKYEEEWYDED